MGRRVCRAMKTNEELTVLITGKDNVTLVLSSADYNEKIYFNHLVSGLCPSFGILNTRKYNVSEHWSVFETFCFPCYTAAGFLYKILNPLAGKSDSFLKNSGHFTQLLNSVNLQSLDNLS
jgi:hypothetical protein